MTITRVGTNQKYADGWDKAFGRKKKSAGKPKVKARAATGKAKKKTK